MKLSEARSRATLVEEKGEVVDDQCALQEQAPSKSEKEEEFEPTFGDDDLEEDLGIALDMMETGLKFLQRLLKQRDVDPSDWKQMRMIVQDWKWFTEQFGNGVD